LTIQFDFIIFAQLLLWGRLGGYLLAGLLEGYSAWRLSHFRSSLLRLDYTRIGRPRSIDG
jgi:hypothetical protein